MSSVLAVTILPLPPAIDAVGLGSEIEVVFRRSAWSSRGLATQSGWLNAVANSIRHTSRNGSEGRLRLHGRIVVISNVACFIVGGVLWLFERFRAGFGDEIEVIA